MLKKNKKTKIKNGKSARDLASARWAEIFIFIV